MPAQRSGSLCENGARDCPALGTQHWWVVYAVVLRSAVAPTNRLLCARMAGTGVVKLAHLSDVVSRRQVVQCVRAGAGERNMGCGLSALLQAD